MQYLDPSEPCHPLFQEDPVTESHNEIVRAGKSYEEFDDFQRSALQARLSERQAHEAFRPPSAAKPSNETEPEEGIYCPLNGEHEMRIMELYAGEFDASLHFKTHVCSLEFEYSCVSGGRTQLAISRATGNPIWYTAISYVWGTIAFVKPATCNGKPFKITVNLDLALRYLRRTDVSVMLWVDQICINQKDLEERTQQVLLMGTIYERAWNTLVWLGEEADGSSDAVNTIIRIGDLRTLTDERAPELKDFDSMDLPAPGSRQWLYLSKLLSRPWFHRVWVIQEVVLSKYVQLQYGRRTVSWFDMGMFASCMISHDLTQYLVSADNNADQLSVGGCIQVEIIDRERDSYSRRTSGQGGLLGTLVYARGAQATDPRDKIFGVMKMTSQTINPDYSKAMFEIYIEAAREILWNGAEPLGLLCCVDHEQPSAHCPSWVPDWSTPRQTTSLGYKWRAMYQANKDSSPEFKLIGDGLFIAGIVCDTISNIVLSADSCLKDIHNPTSPTAQFVIESMRMAIEYCQPYPSHSGLFDAFWHTIVAGKDHTGMLKAPSGFAEIFALLIDSATGRTPSMPDQPIAKRRLTLDNLKTRRPSRVYREIQIAFEAAVKGRKFGTTSKRYIGLFPRGTRPGDQIGVLLGGHIPFVVRPWRTSGSFQLIGECYVHGIMDGEVMQMTNLKKEEIQLI
jgi:WD repeat-containing protein 55